MAKYAKSRFGIALVCQLSLLSSSFTSLVGCTFQHSVQKTQLWMQQAQLLDRHGLSRQQDWVLSTALPIYFAWPLASDKLPSSLQSRFYTMLAQQFQEPFPLLHWQANHPESFQQAILSAQNQGIAILLYPRLLLWKDKVNSIAEFSKALKDEDRVGRDILHVQFLLYDTVNHRLIDNTLLTSQSPWLVWRQRTPESLLKGAVEYYIANMTKQHYQLK